MDNKEKISDVIPKRLCRVCHRALVAIGYKRQNGKLHNDWTSREYHKKCWKEINNY